MFCALLTFWRIQNGGVLQTCLFEIRRYTFIFLRNSAPHARATFVAEILIQIQHQSLF